MFGPNPPCANVLALVETESRFNPEALSNKGAAGPGQFIAATAAGMCRNYPNELCPPRPNDWDWSAKAIARHLKESMDRLASSTASECSAGLMSLSEYNGGPAALGRERALCQVDGGCDTTRWFLNVELQKSRADWAYKENRDYVFRVFQRSEKYVNAGMGRSWCH